MERAVLCFEGGGNGAFQSRIQNLVREAWKPALQRTRHANVPESTEGEVGR